MDEEIVLQDLDGKKLEWILAILFIIGIVILMIYSVKVSNDYNELVYEYNILKRNLSSCIPIELGVW